MNYLLWFQKFAKALLGFLGVLLITTFLISLFSYFNLIPYQVMNILKMVIIILAFFLGGFLVSKNSRQKGWLEGLKCGGIFLLLMLLFRLLILKNGISLTDFIYYLILLIGSIFGGMVGINFTTKK